MSTKPQNDTFYRLGRCPVENSDNKKIKLLTTEIEPIKQIDDKKKFPNENTEDNDFLIVI